jgi:hypothetical protein
VAVVARGPKASWAGSSAGRLEPSFKKDWIFHFPRKKKTHSPFLWKGVLDFFALPEEHPESLLPRHLISLTPGTRAHPNPYSISLRRRREQRQGRRRPRDGAPPRPRRRREPGFRSISPLSLPFRYAYPPSLPPSSRSSLARECWRDRSGFKVIFFRLMGGWRFSVDLTLGEVQLRIRTSSVV